jgi:adenylosuccinate lyase
VAKKLGLAVEPVSTQVIPRDRHAAFFATLAVVASSIENLATEIRHLQRTEVREAEEFFSAGQKGSSSMPHKRNPVLTENLTGLARVVRSAVMPALENVTLWHERDISHSSVERVILPDSFIALDHMLRRFTRIVTGMVVHIDRMRENLNRSRGVVFSGTVLLALAQKGISREQAYEWVQRNAMLSFAEERDFKTLLESDTDITRVLTKAEIERAFDLNEQFRHVDEVLDRVFITAKV